MSALQITPAEAAALATVDAVLDSGFGGGVEQPPGNSVVLPMAGYTSPQSIPHQTEIKEPWKVAIVAAMRAIPVAAANANVEGGAPNALYGGNMNLDAGLAGSVYGGVAPIDCGGI